MIDLHSHSIYSDGTNTPEELLQMAEKRGLKALALTDHDTVGGIPPFLQAAESLNVEAVPGIELSADCQRGTMHILGYFMDYTNACFLERVQLIREGREERNREILKKLNKLGYRLMWDDVEDVAGADVVGRPHFAEALRKRGLVKTRKAAFELLLAKGRPAYAERNRYSGRECIEMIRDAGGVPVLAHPATIYLPDDQLRGLIMGLAENGLGGLEVYYNEHRAKNIEKFKGWAEELNLITTGGTDYHGKNTPDLRIGVGFGKLHVPDEILDQLKTAAA